MMGKLVARGRVIEVNEEELDPFVQHNRKELLEKTKEMGEEIEKAATYFDRSIQEAPFKKFFLPVMAGYVTDEKICRAINNKWLDVAGSPWEQVNIVDQHGNLVIVCPPVFASDIFLPSLGESKRLFNLLRGIDRVRETNPGRYEVAVNDILENTVFEGIDREVIEKNFYRWRELFDHYADYLISIRPAEIAVPVDPDNQAVKRIANDSTASDHGVTDDEDF